jgi:glycosyltransferase involved in cell wall biosynthesis
LTEPPLSTEPLDLHLLVPGDPARRTGGSIYDARIVDELRRAGLAIRVHGLAGRFPDADALARNAFEGALEAVSDGGMAVLDGLALGGLPELAERHRDRIDLVALVHHPLCDETGLAPDRAAGLEQLERRALAACRGIITTSAFTARRLAELDMNPVPIRVVEPGTAPAPLASSATGEDDPVRPRLLCVGSLVPRKGQDVLVRALATLTDREWRCSLVGHDGRDPDFVAALDRAIATAGLADRIERIGELDEDDLDRAYRASDLFVLPSHYEGFGMVVTEALARGLPVITTTGGALADTLPSTAGLHVPPGDPDSLARALARWLDDGDLRRDLRRGARRARRALPTWSTAAERFRQALFATARVAPEQAR